MLCRLGPERSEGPSLRCQYAIFYPAYIHSLLGVQEALSHTEDGPSGAILYYILHGYTLSPRHNIYVYT